MLCKTCGYRLWNLPSRRCPECGAAFRPSEFEFTPNSVRFQCPHCGQHYYGTGEKGHLVPVEFDCVSCGRHVHMDDMVLLPTEGVSEEQTNVPRMPWLDRRKLGLIRAWFATVGMALFSPAKLMRLTPPLASASQAWWFAALTNAIVMTVAFVPFFLLPTLLSLSGTGGVPGLAFAGGIAVTALILLLVLMVGVALWACVAHGLLRLTGQTAGPLRQTFHAIGYGAGANALTGIPCLGFYFGLIWWIISATIMLKESQRVSALRAVFAGITPPVVSVALVVGGYIWLMFSIVGGARFAATMPTTIASRETQMLLSGLQVYAAANGGRYPNHAIDLVASTSNLVTAHSFVTGNSATRSAQVPVGGTTLEKYPFLPANRRPAVEQAAANALPKGTIAHRLGDFVFTYHGIGQGPPFKGLWLVILWPDPAANSGRASPGDVAVGTTDGTVVTFSRAQFPAELRRENQRRQAAGLAPLPDPSSVTHKQPAVASSPSTQPSAPAERE